jgi:hypothetical protein
MADFNSLADFAKHLTGIIAYADHAEHHALEHAARIVETEAKRVIGTYDYGWPPLAPATQADRARKGFSADEPLLRTGEMRDSIQHTVYRRGAGFGAHEAEVGSNNDKAVWQELGTSTIPARSFLAGAAVHSAPHAVAWLGQAYHAILTSQALPTPQTVR